MSEDPYGIPSEREMKDFQFRQMKKIRVFDSPDDLPRDRSNLLAISNRYGMTFVGQDRTLKVFRTEDVINAAKVDGNPNDIVENVTCQEVTVDLPVHHLALCSDELTLSVCGASEGVSLTLDFYDVRTFFNKARPEKKPFASYKGGAQPGVTVQDLKWSPVEPFRLAVCLSDGGMMVLDVKDGVTVGAQLPPQEGITCVCWSPKGKQVAAGKQNATVVQYTPVLQEKKVIPCPQFYTSDNPVKVLDVLWLSTYNFAVVYAAADGSLTTPPDLVVVSLPKKDERKPESFLNFSEFVYGACTERQHHYFLHHIEDWDLVLAASAASIEVNIIAKQEDKTNWELWVLEDASRAELPVTLSSEDTLPMGVGIDYTSQGEIHISDEKKLPPAPTLLILSTDGVLCPFSLLNLNPGAKQLVLPANGLALDGGRPPLPKSGPPAQPAAASKPPPVFPSFQTCSAPEPAPSTAAPPPASSSLFSFGSASSTASAFPSSSSFSFSIPKPSAAPAPAPSVPSFSTPAVKPPTEGTGTSVTAASTLTGLKGPPEPAIPNIRVNLSDRFLAADTPAPAVQSFSFTSTPKAGLDFGAQTKPLTKPSVPAVTRPVPAVSPALQKPSPAPTAPPAGPPAQVSSVKADKSLQQKKDSDPVMVGIKEEIAHFQKEMDELKSRINRADFRVGSNEEMRELRKASEDLHAFTLEIKETTESVHGDISALKTTLLEGFAGVEEARAQSELNKDKGYLQLLYKKPLDPRRDQQLKEIRRLYQYVKFAVEDVNDVLDLEWEKHLEKKRKQKLLVVPEREALYTALTNNMDIINQQKKKLEQLVRDLQNLRLYNRTSVWNQPSPAPSASSQGLDSELESLKNALIKASLDYAPKAPSKSPSKMTPLKQNQLRNFLSKRQTPPVRSTAPANLSRSAFLSPKYYEDQDDGSSTSSLSQALDMEESLGGAEEEVQEEDRPGPAPAPVLALPRHPAVVRTPSILPGFSLDSSDLSPVPQWPLTLGAGPKISMDSADSTALATKTVKHGPPPTEKTPAGEKATPTTLPAAQAAARAALNRQMNSQQKPVASLTESTLKTVPQVVNVQDLKEKGPAPPVPPDPSSSAPASAAHVAQQLLASSEAKRNSSQIAVKAPVPVTDPAPAPSNFVFGQPFKPDAAPSSSTLSLTEPSSKGLSPAGFSFTLSTTASLNQGALSSQTATPLVKPSQKPGSTLLSSSLGEPSKSAPVPSFQLPKAQEESLGPFSELRVGQGQGEEVKEPPKSSAAFSFRPGGSLPSSAFVFGSQPKPGPAGNAPDSSGPAAEAAKNPGVTAPPVPFKAPDTAPPAASTKAFTFSSASSSSSVPSFSSLLAAPLPAETPAVTDKPPEPEPSPPPDSSSATPPEEAPSEPSPEPPALSTSTPSPEPVTEEPPPGQPSHQAADHPATQTPSAQEATPTPTAPAETVPISVPVQETRAQTPPPVEHPPTASPTAPGSTAPGSIFTQPAVSSSSSTSGSVSSFTPVISTAAVSSTAPAPVFGQQPVSSSAPPAFGSSTFGTASTTSSFGKPVFGQPASVGFGSASGFSFGQSTFGTGSGFGQAPAATGAPAAVSSSTAAAAGTGGGAGGGGGLFGSVSSSSASSFSFAPSSTSTGANTDGGMFQSTPTFGQSASSGFGQGSLFGGNNTTTSSAPSSGFSFGQPAAVFGGSSSSSSVFGQQQSSGSVFGQASSSSGLFGSSTGNPSSSSSSSGGGFFSGLGGKPSEDAANKNPFGSTGSSAFGQTNQTGGSSLFGNSGAKTFGFGGSSFGEQKSGGTFSAGGGSVAAQGFGSFSTPPKTGGFGSAPVFGSPPAFGNAAAFGGTATFGSAASFSSPLGSSPGKVFGEGTAAASVGGFGFASPPPGPTFGSLAGQSSAPSFGSLAQQTPGFGAQNSGFSGFGGFGGFGSTNTNQSSSQTFGGWRS